MRSGMRVAVVLLTLILVGLFQELLQVLLQQEDVRSTVRTLLFSGEGLTLRGAAILFVLATGLSVLSRGRGTGLRARLAVIGFHFAVNTVNLVVVGLWIVFLARDRRQLLERWPLWGVWVAGYLFVCVFHSEPRYLFPARALMLVGGAVLLGAQRRPAAAEAAEGER